ncbi:MAG: Nif3-like dinuclear metal center hexameric protein [Bacteroidota bacterium]
MAMLIEEAVRILDQIFPPGLQQSYDRCGFQCGVPAKELTGILVGLDVSEALVEEALERNCNLLVTHHPLLFDPLTQLGQGSRVERLVQRVLEAGISVYAAHTNADAMPQVVTGALADRLGLQNTAVLEPMKGVLKQLVVYIPVVHAEPFRDAMFRAGAGSLGNYGEASFGVLGKGTFKPLEGAQPFFGQVGHREEVDEWRLEFVFEAWKTEAVLRAMTEAHPYQEVAYQLYSLEQKVSGFGMGLVGDWEEAIPWEAALQRIHEVLGGPLRYSRPTVSLQKSPMIRRMALCGGAGASLWPLAKAAGAQLYLSSEFKHHHFLEAEGSLLLVEAGHAETEIPGCEMIHQRIAPFFRTFAVLNARTSQNPTVYLT